MRTRAERRYHAKRMLAHARRAPIARHTDDEWLCKNYDNITACSCYMCGNPRRNPWSKTRDKRTRAEQRSALGYKEKDWD